MEKICTTFLAILILFGCSTTQEGKTPKRVAPIAININPSNSRDLSFVNLDYYRLKVLDDLDDFLSVDLDLVEPEENPEVILNVEIDNFILWPRDERLSRRTLSRVVPIGKDAAGKVIYQTVRATVDIVQVQRRANGTFVTNLVIKGDTPFTFKRSFPSSYNYVNTYVDNVVGDPRAVDASIYMARDLGFEPREDDFLLELSKREMLPRLSSELRKYYK